MAGSAAGPGDAAAGPADSAAGPAGLDAGPAGPAGGLAGSAAGPGDAAAGPADSAGGPAGLDAGPAGTAGGLAGPDAGPVGPRADCPKPLHDPDPYSTPPYGGPGPWAPAPPVQHPAAHPSTPPSSAGDATPAPWQRYDPWAVPAPLQQTGDAVAAERRPRSRSRGVLLGWALVIAVTAGAGGGIAGAWLERNGGLGGVQLPRAGKVPAGRAPDSVAGIAARALPGVVTLHVGGGGEQDTGTGFVLDTRGHILTNNHVVESAGTGVGITVTFSSGDTARAKVIGRDSGYDLAVVQVQGVRGLTPMPLGNSDDVHVGDPVVAIGAPFDLANTVTSGIISAKERPVTAGGDKGDGSDVSYVDALQTDAPINPGNSGGPLLDSQGLVIGVNSDIRSAADGTDSQDGQAGSIGLGFAIPVNQARRVAEQLISKGKATHPVIGVTLDMSYTGEGARIDTQGADGGPAVTKGGPGDTAGLKAGDVITEVDGVGVHSAEELIVRTRAHRPGDRLRLTVRGDGGTREVSLVLGASDRN
ncbi:trypsin-like peptidase domain-containing protein [Streptomyces sp. NPDC006739]|uniref:S1C family serine protease n=1 Tax=Streptomyces sp. NPDC006739 TaxID=3364763 RepID=UPI00368220C7